MWMVRAGQGAEYLEDFRSKSIVAIGWSEVGELPVGLGREEVVERFASAGWAAGNKFKIAAAAGQVWRYLNEIQVGDAVVTYDPPAACICWVRSNRSRPGVPI
jgi:restriction system protein